MTNTMTPFPSRFAEALMVIFGLIMMVTPLALWVAWSNAAFFVILFSGLFSAWAYWAIYRARHRSEPETGEGAELHRELSEEAMNELHKGWPWYCHHTTDGTVRFRRTMNRFADLTNTPRRY